MPHTAMKLSPKTARRISKTTGIKLDFLFECMKIPHETFFLVKDQQTQTFEWMNRLELNTRFFTTVERENDHMPFRVLAR